jgi:hypothetical protein
LAALFAGARILLFMGLPLEGLRGYGDLVHFYRLAVMGIPFVDYWVEFPPLFPFLSAALAKLASGNEHAYDYLIVFLMSVVQAGTLVVFVKIAGMLWHESSRRRMFWLYFVLLLVVPYGWWYFDPIAVLAMMWGLLSLLRREDLRATGAFAVGTLTKWFPALALGAVWRFRKPGRAFWMTVGVIGVMVLVFVVLWGFAPDFTLASLRSQWNKGSWETVWALLDGNLGTGNFGPESERYDPARATLPRGKPAVIPPLVTLAVFLLIGLWIFLRTRPDGGRKVVGFFGVTWCLFLLWSPGYSPQWVLYLLPLILLTFEEALAVGFSVNLALVSLLEWPVLLSRGRFDLLWLPVVIRTLLLVVLAYAFATEVLELGAAREDEAVS